MCLRQLSIFNPSSKVPSIGGALRLKVPCGKCFECKESKKSSYFVRTFAEYQRLESRVKARQAVVYFDTLTYDSKNLPKWNDIPVFDHTHIQKFLKRFRRSLEYKGYDSIEKVKYFICSEFGEKRHRPHYHVLFFLDFWIEPHALWKLVRDAWSYGRTDRLYPTIKAGVYKQGAAERYVDRNGALKYVSGYVVKDDSFMTQFNAKVKELIDSGHKLSDKELRALHPRFFLSRGFGLSFIDDKQLEYHFDYNYFVEHGKVTIQDDKHIKRDFPLPMYYKRKMFFTLKSEVLSGCPVNHDENGFCETYKRGKKKGLIKFNVRYYWEPNPDYIQYQSDSNENKVNDLANKYNDIFSNIPSNKRASNGTLYRDLITQQLGNRTFHDLAVYSSFYRNRLCLADTLYMPNDDFLQSFYNSKFISLKHVRGDKFADRESMSNQEHDLKCHIICQSSCKGFEYFDDILTILESEQWNQSCGVAKFKIDLRKQRSKYKNLINSY